MKRKECDLFECLHSWNWSLKERSMDVTCRSTNDDDGKRGESRVDRGRRARTFDPNIISSLSGGTLRLDLALTTHDVLVVATDIYITAVAAAQVKYYILKSHRNYLSYYHLNSPTSSQYSRPPSSPGHSLTNHGTQPHLPILSSQRPHGRRERNRHPGL